MSNEPERYWPSEETLKKLGFYEGYGDLWICEGAYAGSAAIETDEFGTMGYLLVDGRVTYNTDIDSLEDLKQLIVDANAPF